MQSMKKQKDVTLEDGHGGRWPICYWGTEEKKHPERMKRLGQSRHETYVWMCMVVKVKPNAVKSNIA